MAQCWRSPWAELQPGPPAQTPRPQVKPPHEDSTPCLGFAFRHAKQQLVQERAHMIEFRVWKFGFSDCRLFASFSPPQNTCLAVTPCLPRITLSITSPIKDGKVRDQTIPKRIHTSRPLHVCTIKVTWAFSAFRIPGPMILFTLQATHSHAIDRRMSLPQGGVRLGEASYTTTTSQWSLRELQGAQHIQKAEHLYLDSQINLAT